MGVLREIFTWWNGATIGTRLFTARNGEKVGEDEAGNTYYRNADDTRRWVIYRDVSEASAVTADWHGWLHHTFDEPPENGTLRRWAWEAEHEENRTGTDLAYRPPGSLTRIAAPAAAAPSPSLKPSYTAWTPE